MRVPPDARTGNARLGSAHAYARLLRNPKQNTWYGDLDPRSWRVVVHQVREQGLGLADLRRAATVIRAARTGGRYLCTLPRSGTNWVSAMINCGLSLHQGGTGAFTLQGGRTVVGDDEWVFDGPRFGWPAPPQSFAMAIAQDRDREIGGPVFTFSHDPIVVGLIDHRRSRPIVIVREPFEVARSLVQKEQLAWLLAAPSRLPASIDRVDRFFTVWEQRLTDPDTAARTLVLRYEDVVADPVASLALIDRHWELGVDAETWSGAVKRCSWDAMADAATQRPETTRITLERVELPADVTAYLHERCDHLGVRFGYGSAAPG